jgi:hypothetical protein
MNNDKSSNDAGQRDVEIDDYVVNRMIEPEKGGHRIRSEENSGPAEWWFLEDRKT